MYVVCALGRNGDLLRKTVINRFHGDFLGNRIKMASLKLSECVCPICLCILIEPVTMPCNHELCMPCFRKNVEQANLTCPMCRLRISNWARKHSGRLINEERWRSIREAFPVLCQRRMETGDEGDDDVLDLMTQPPPPVIHVAQPGEIGEEFKKESEKVKEEYRRELEDAVKRSEEYIKELQKEEVKRFEERQEELLSQEKQDAELARQLAKEEPDEMIYRGERVHVMREQVLKDEELARRIQMTEQSLSNTPTPKSPDIIILPSSGGSSRKNSASSSTIKCLSIEKFMSPMSRKSRSPEGAAIEDQPSTSAHSPVNASPRKEENSPSPSGNGASIKRRGAFSPVVLKAPRLKELDDIHLRAHSTDSNDSISDEMNHFKPIHVSPRTARRKLPDGRAESPPIVFTTPRNLQRIEDDADTAKETSIKMSSLLKARWKDMEAERTNQVNETSKATMTSLARQLKKQMWRQQSSKQVRQGDQGNRQGEPPQKKAKVEMSGAGDASLRAKDPSANNLSNSSHTLLQMRVEETGKTDTTLIADIDDIDDATDYNHNCNNSRILDAKLKSSPHGKCDRSGDRLSSLDGSDNGNANARVQRISGKGEDEVDGSPKTYKKKVHTPIKEYAMREHTKLQTRVTNSIKDLFSARRSKSKASNGDCVKNGSEPLLPSLPKPEDGLNTKLEKSLPNGNSGDTNCSRSKAESLQQTKTVSSRQNKAKSANGRDSASSNQRCNSGDGSRSSSSKVEVSYEEWLKSNECETDSMQAKSKGTGNDSVSDSSTCNISQNFNSVSKLDSGIIAENSTAQLTICDDSLTTSDDPVLKMASQDSDVSMASVDDESGHLRNKSNGNRKDKNRGKVKPSKGRGSSRKSPRKSEETILRYMELLDQEQKRLTQEDEDHLLAERLQREFDKEMRQRDAVDRSKGTDDAYELRQQQRTLYRYME
nr:uncharacterized protein LOC129278622 [Lytechinus pictus]